MRALDGLLLIGPLLGDRTGARAKLDALAQKCRLLATDLLRKTKSDELWRVGAQLAGAEVSDVRVWHVWSTEILDRREEGVSRAQRVAHIRKRARRYWSLTNLPSGLEEAMRSCLRSPSLQ